MKTYTPPNCIFDGPVTNLLSVLCILIEMLSHAHVNFIECFYVNDEPECKFLYTETIKLYCKKALMVSSLALLLVVFRVMARQAWQGRG